MISLGEEILSSSSGKAFSTEIVTLLRQFISVKSKKSFELYFAENQKMHTVFPQIDPAGTINFLRPKVRALIEGGLNSTFI